MTYNQGCGETRRSVRFSNGLARWEFGSFPVGRSTVGRASDSLGCLKTNFKKLTNDKEYEPVPYIMISQSFSVTVFLYSLSIISLLWFVTLAT